MTSIGALLAIERTGDCANSYMTAYVLAHNEAFERDGKLWLTAKGRRTLREAGEL